MAGNEGFEGSPREGTTVVAMVRMLGTEGEYIEEIDARIRTESQRPEYGEEFRLSILLAENRQAAPGEGSQRHTSSRERLIHRHQSYYIIISYRSSTPTSTATELSQWDALTPTTFKL